MRHDDPAHEASRGRLARHDLQPERLIRPFHTQRRRKGRDGRVPPRSPDAARATPSREIEGDRSCRCRIARSPRWRSDGSLEKKAGSGSARCARCSPSCPTTRTVRTRTCASGCSSEIEDTRVRSSAVHRDSIAVRREGAAQIALVGPPNVGKSSLLQALSEIQIKTGDYPFTTLRPVPALTRIGGVLVQLVEIPGLIEGATDDRGGGRALLGVLRTADAIVYCARADADPAELEAVRAEVAAAGHRQAGVPRRDARRRGRSAARSSGSRRRSRTSTSSRCRSSTKPSLDAFRDAVWALTGLIRVRLRNDGATDDEPVALDPGSTVADVADWVHHDLAASFSGRACLGAVGPLRRPARGPRPRGPRRRRRRDRRLSSGYERLPESSDTCGPVDTTTDRDFEPFLADVRAAPRDGGRLKWPVLLLTMVTMVAVLYWASPNVKRRVPLDHSRRRDRRPALGGRLGSLRGLRGDHRATAPRTARSRA